MTLKPGIHAGVSFTDYQAIDAVNNSLLKLFHRTSKHAHWDMTHPEEDTAALRLGDATHVAILEPGRFEVEYVRAPKFDKRSNKGKADAAAWEAEHPNQAALLPHEWDKAVAMRDEVWAHPMAADLLKGQGQNEMTVIWIDPETGILCKGRIDRFTSKAGWTFLLDFKTAKDGSPRGFATACAQYFYHQQAALYLDGLNAISPHKRRFIHLVVENQPPYCVAVHELGDQSIEEGRQQYKLALKTYAECIKSGDWPGYPVGINEIEIPIWGFQLTSTLR